MSSEELSSHGSSESVHENEKKNIVPEVMEVTPEMRDNVLERLNEKSGRDRLNATRNDLDFILDKILTMSDEEALNILNKAIIYHDDDFNFPVETMAKIKLLVQGQDVYGADVDTYEFDLKVEACLIGHYSPYPEVRSVTEPYEDDVPVETIRVYFLAIIWTIVGSGIRQFFSPRQPSISLSSTVIQLFLYPCGRALELLPDWGFTFRGKRHSINPGPWTFKEQMLTTVMLNVAVGGAYVALYNIVVQKLPIFYGNTWASPGYQFLLIFSTQFLGFGFAGVLRRWVIYPVKAVWPSVLPSIALSRALLKPEKKENIHGWTISRYWFFLICCAGSFLYFWFPDYIFQALSTFNWLTWIAPHNFNLALITGSVMGLGINPWPTFDWNIASFVTPLVTPFYSQVNQYIGTFISAFIILGMYMTNYKWTSYLPLNTNALRTNTNNVYAVSEILTNGLLDESKYQKYSPPFYSAGDLMVYGSTFAFYPASILWTLVNEGRSIMINMKEFVTDLKDRKRSNYDRFDDPFSRLMRKHKEVPDWWFLIVLVISFVLGVVCLTQYPTDTPVWGLIIIILVNFVFLIPISLIHAVTGYGFGLNVLCELISGYMFPGNGSALMILKAFGYNIDGRAESYISDQKIAHYSKIPPRAVFRGQILTSLIQCIVAIGVVNWQIANIDDLCDPKQAQRFTCPGPRTYYSASITWGVIGPKRMFNGLYPILQWCFLIGALVIIPFFFAKRYLPKYFRFANPVLIIGGMASWAPYNLSYVTPGFYLSIIFMYFIRRRYLAWWEKYNYVLSSALDAGVAFSAIIIFFAVNYHPKKLSWWGNTVTYAGIDGGVGQQVLLKVPEVGYFGPEPGHYP
ncbi:OPT oligopeptide transporter protein-domain-containing protein [Lipomyces orientalis]|uniref:OPT oligopeptide transporter protein-domain-containing protein n=1 Tax=Lipomyces orientalis TaxID=1233043 RepID=A0ACC3TUA9_9ASCO